MGEGEETGPSAMGHVETQPGAFDVGLASWAGPYPDLLDVLPLDVHSKVEGQSDPEDRAA